MQVKIQDIENACLATDIVLTDDDVKYLEELYVPHPIIGAIDKNPAQDVVLLDEKK